MNLLRRFFVFMLASVASVAQGFDLSMLPVAHPEMAISLVKHSTAILPQFDSISHHVLVTNDFLINRVLDTPIDPRIQKAVILNIVEMTKQGDEMGGYILDYYYKFIDYLL